jgi:hypothetical protein
VSKHNLPAVARVHVWTNLTTLARLRCALLARDSFLDLASFSSVSLFRSFFLLCERSDPRIHQKIKTTKTDVNNHKPSFLSLTKNTHAQTSLSSPTLDQY